MHLHLWCCSSTHINVCEVEFLKFMPCTVKLVFVSLSVIDSSWNDPVWLTGGSDSRTNSPGLVSAHMNLHIPRLSCAVGILFHSKLVLSFQHEFFFHNQFAVIWLILFSPLHAVMACVLLFFLRLWNFNKYACYISASLTIPLPAHGCKSCKVSALISWIFSLLKIDFLVCFSEAGVQFVSGSQ